VGALLLLEGPVPPIGEFRAALQPRIRAVPELNRRLERRPGGWRRPHWVTDDPADFPARIQEASLGRPGGPGSLGEVVDAFFSTPSDPGQRPWELRLVPAAGEGRAAVVVKVHHTIGDSRAIIGALIKLFDRAGEWRPAGERPGPAPRSHRPWRHRAVAAGRALRGLYHLAAAGNAPASTVCGPFTSGRRRFIPLALPAREVARTARQQQVGIADLLLAMTAEAVSQLLQSRGEQTTGRRIRIAVPRARTRPDGQAAGNRSAAVSLDLPVGPLSPAGRLAAVRGQVEVHVGRGEPDAAALILRAMNFLPLRLQRRAAALVYHRRWFNMLVSVFPGMRQQYRLLGARVTEVYPVLALADGVGLALGAMTWAGALSVGILADASLVPDADVFAAGFSRAFAHYAAAAGQPVG
jgi:diacylglycerol O-acyltransferase